MTSESTVIGTWENLSAKHCVPSIEKIKRFRRSCSSFIFQSCVETKQRSFKCKASISKYISFTLGVALAFRSSGALEKGGGALCFQLDFTRTFEANTKCNNINYVWSHFYQILVVLMYRRRLWNNIFDTDIFRCINTHIKGVYLAFFGIFMLLEMSVSKILLHRRLWYFKTTKIW